MAGEKVDVVFGIVGLLEGKDVRIGDIFCCLSVVTDSVE